MAKPMAIFSIEDRDACTQIRASVRQFAFADAARVISGWVRKEGWRYSPWQLYEKYADRTFDWKHGTDTRVLAELPALQIDSPNKRHGQRYQASPVFSLRRVLRRLDIDFSDFSFVDFGSGKGRTLLLAGEFPFKQVTGVEFSAQLNASAAGNISAYRKRQAGGVATLHCDATAFELPPDNLVLYFFNPFKEAVLSTVLANICASIRLQPRRIIIVYLFLESPQLLDGVAGLRLRECWHRFRIYELAAPQRLHEAAR